MTPTYFASGSNHQGEILGFARCIGSHVGAVALRVRGGALSALEAFPRRVFVDSGAFSEVEFPPGGPRIVRPLGAAHWRRVFWTYGTLAEGLGSRVYVVAPDCVGHQPESLARVNEYADDVRRVAAFGARILLPVQKGAEAMADFYRRAADVLACDVTPAIPMKKDATTPADLYRFIEAVRPSSCHLLGLGPGSALYVDILRMFDELAPDCDVSCDSCLLRQHAGKTNGPGGGPRAMTAACAGLQHVGPTERKCQAVAQTFARYWIDHGLASVDGSEPRPPLKLENARRQMALWSAA